jgi:hypothetical protein
MFRLTLPFWYGAHMMQFVQKKHFSLEEAALQVAREELARKEGYNLSSDSSFQEELIKDYEMFKKYLEDYSPKIKNFELFMKEHGFFPNKKSTRKNFEVLWKSSKQVKNKEEHNLFLKFYKQAKKDLKEKGKISEETFALIKQ